MSISWDTVQAALVAWVRGAVGSAYSAAGQIIWQNQNASRPAHDFIGMEILALAPTGGSDEAVQTQDLSRTGQEIQFTATGLRELTLSVQAYCGGVIGSAAAYSVLSKAQTALSLETVRGALQAAGLSVSDPGNVQNLSALLGSDFEGRAVLTVKFYIYETVSDFAGYIAKCTPTSYLGPPDSGTRDLIDI